MGYDQPSEIKTTLAQLTIRARLRPNPIKRKHYQSLKTLMAWEKATYNALALSKDACPRMPLVRGEKASFYRLLG